MEHTISRELEASLTALSACLIATGNTRAWWYSINDSNSNTPLHGLLHITESHLIQLVLDIKLFILYNMFKSLSISKHVWLRYFTMYSVENCEISKSRLHRVKGKPTIYYLRLGKFQSPTHFTALQQIDMQARPPNSHYSHLPRHTSTQYAYRSANSRWFAISWQSKCYNH